MARQGKGANGSSIMGHMKEDKYSYLVDRLYRHFSSYKKGDTVPWADVERIMGIGRDDLGGRNIVKRLVRDMLRKRHITCMVVNKIGIRLLTDMEAAVEVPKMRQKRARRQIRKGLKETEHVDHNNLSDRAAQSLAMSRKAMKREYDSIQHNVNQVSTLMKPSTRQF